MAGTALGSGLVNESPLGSVNAPEDKDLPILTPSAGPPGGRSLPEAEILTRLVALNHARAAEEKPQQIIASHYPQITLADIHACIGYGSAMSHERFVAVALEPVA